MQRRHRGQRVAAEHLHRAPASARPRTARRTRSSSAARRPARRPRSARGGRRTRAARSESPSRRSRPRRTPRTSARPRTGIAAACAAARSRPSSAGPRTRPSDTRRAPARSRLIEPSVAQPALQPYGRRDTQPEHAVTGDRIVDRGRGARAPRGRRWASRRRRCTPTCSARTAPRRGPRLRGTATTSATGAAAAAPSTSALRQLQPTAYGGRRDPRCDQGPGPRSDGPPGGQDASEYKNRRARSRAAPESPIRRCIGVLRLTRPGGHIECRPALIRAKHNAKNRPG